MCGGKQPSLASQLAGSVSPADQPSCRNKRLRVVDDIYDSPTLRQVFRKTGKALDTAIAENVSLKRERDQLAAAIEAQKPQKRRKVKQTAQQGFVRMVDVRRVKEEMASSSDVKGKGRAIKRPLFEVSSGDETDSEIEECITVS